ncbi:MAG: hypothetical protein GX879_02490 [Bacteroidales bacterium]|nr:hypothetical protein [Bacteroidales bacterium]
MIKEYTQVNIDWNWFFSALAQSGAALIAIIAAFIISKLLGESEKQEILSDDYLSFEMKRKDLIRRIDNSPFDWCDRLTIKYSSKIRNAIKDGLFAEVEDLGDEGKIEALFIVEPNLYGVDNCIDYLNERIEEYDINYPSGIRPSSFAPDGLWHKISNKKEQISSLELDSLHLIELFENLKKSFHNKALTFKPIKITIFFLMFGLFFNVIYPLHFLPLKINENPVLVYTLDNFLKLFFSTKGFLLLLLFLFIEGIFIYFLIFIYKIEKKYKSLINGITDDILDVKSYSSFFHNN